MMIIGFVGSIQIAFASPFFLNNGPGDGTILVGVDGYGSFGLSVGTAGESTDATFDPIGPTSPADTTFNSAIAIRIGDSGPRTFLTTGNIFGSGILPNPGVSGTQLIGTSAFMSNNLQFDLVQTLTPTFSGTTLTQSYTITNPTGLPINDIEIVRYMDGDLKFIPSEIEGGGRFIDPDGNEILFETDIAGATSTTPTTFVGIIAEGGDTLTANRFQIDFFATIAQGIVDGDPLSDLIFGDTDADQFINAPGYDVSLALRNTFSLGAGESVVYVTKTIFGNGAPEDVEIDPPTEEVVGGNVLQIDTFALLIAGAQSVTWIIPISLSILGIGLFLVKGKLH